MKVEIVDRQTRFRVDRTRLGRLAQWLMDQVRGLAPETRWGELTLILTDDAGIRPVQSACFGKHEPTDVVSLRYDPMPPETEPSAEVVLNLERAYQERGRAGGMDRELALYLAHGCQHLAGATDDTEQGRRGMQRCENRWLRSADELGYVKGLVNAEGP